MEKTALPPRWLLLLSMITVLGPWIGCGGGDGGTNRNHSNLPACTSDHLFSEHVAPLSAIDYVAPIGTLAPVGGSPLPKGHTGYRLNAADVPITAPGDIVIHTIRKTTYLVSPTRQGYVDYAIFFNVCAEVSGWFGHLSSLPTAITDQLGSMACDDYNTVDETIRSCNTNVNISVSAGSELGTAGTPPHSPALDVGMQDTRVSNFVNPSRYATGNRGFICPWDWFTPPIKSDLYPLIGDGVTYSIEPPQCGSMSIDKAGTAQGRWTLASAPADGSDPTSGDFFVLAPNPYAGTSQVVISTRIAPLDVADLPEFTLASSGRINIAPANIQPDGLIYCYDVDLATSEYSFLIQMASSSTLKVERRTHSAGASVCNNAASTWTFSGAAISLIR